MQAKNPYLGWSRQVCLAALASRGIVLHDPDTISRSDCRTALEEADKNASFRFMDLPREMRDNIYEYALPERTVVKRVATATPALLQASPQICEESQQIYVAVNTIQLRTRYRLQDERERDTLPAYFQYGLHREDHDWLLHIGTENVAKIRHIVVSTRGDGLNWPGAVHIDLTSTKASTWGFTSSCGCDECEKQGPNSLGKWEEFCSMKAEKLEAEADRLDFEAMQLIATAAQNDEPRPEINYLEIMMAYASADRAADRVKVVRNAIVRGQRRLDLINKHCGTGKTVAPTIQALTLLANAAHAMVRDLMP